MFFFFQEKAGIRSLSLGWDFSWFFFGFLCGWLCGGGGGGAEPLVSGKPLNLGFRGDRKGVG